MCFYAKDMVGDDECLVLDKVNMSDSNCGSYQMVYLTAHAMSWVEAKSYGELTVYYNFDS